VKQNYKTAIKAISVVTIAIMIIGALL